MPRPGFVLEVDRNTPPVLFWRGENFSLEKLPADRSRVIYAPEPLPPLDDIDGAIVHALNNPIDHDPLPALLFPGMKLTIAFDDVSLPLPPMQRPDVRQRVIEAVLDMAADAGVDDVHIIAALALHRRMTEAELRHAVGDRVYDAFAPRGMLYQHDAEDPDQLEYLGQTPHGEDVEINKRAATSDLLVYVNINLVAMDGGWKSTATGLSSYKSLQHHHNPHTMEHTRSFMDRHKSELHKSNWRMGKVLLDAGVKVFQIETTLNTDTFPKPFAFLSKREWEWSVRDRASFVGTAAALKRTPARLARNIFHSIEAPHQMTSIQAGEVEAVHEVTTENVWKQQLVEVRTGVCAPPRAPGAGAGPDRHPDDGHPVHLPLQRQLDHEPDPGDVYGSRVPVQHVPRQAAGARRRRGDHDPPDAVGLPPGASSELHRLLRAGAGRDHRPPCDAPQVRETLRRGRVVQAPLSHQLRLPRRAPVLHVVLGCTR
ncbi:MAG TPA: lactate racemase domain-containing protein, partial [Ilumatobacteraceae bacterium]|nr:lactate racemase domain-containing protein [Ilumatobacteraceae bacterium]